MSTRGALGFRLNEKDYITYNHSDSYPDWLGRNVAEWAASVKDWDKVKEKVLNLKRVNRDKQPGAHHRLALAEFHDPSVDDGKSWYSLLRDTQGNPDAVLRAGFYIPNERFLKDSLYCEYAYIINLDTMELEAYVGYQKEKHNRGRYGRMRKTNGYYPVALISTIPIADLGQFDWITHLENLTEMEE